MRFSAFSAVFLTSFSCLSSAWGLQLQVVAGAENSLPVLRISTDDNAVAVAAPQANQVWIAGAGTALETPSLAMLKPLGVVAVTPLQQAGGQQQAQGVALTFQKPYPWHVHPVETGAGYVLQRGRDEAAVPQQSVVQLKDALLLPERPAATPLLTFRHPETGYMLTVMPVQASIPAFPFVEQGDFHTLWGGAWDADAFLVEPLEQAEQEGLVLHWERNPQAVPKAEVMMTALPQLGEDGVMNTSTPATALKWVEADQLQVQQEIPAYIQQPYHAGEALRFTPLREKRDPAALERAYKFSGAAGALRTALEKVEQVQPSGKRVVDLLQDVDAKHKKIPFPTKAKDRPASASATDVVAEDSVLNRGDAFLIATPSAPGKRFRDQEAQAIYQLGLAGTDPVLRDEAVINLARVYLNFQRPREALVALQQTVLDENGHPVSAMARTLMGATQVLEGNAKAAVDTLKRGVEPHRTLWYAAALADIGRVKEMEESIEDYTSSIQVLPRYMQTYLYQVEAERLLARQQYSHLEDFIDRISATQFNGETPRELNYILARSNLELGNTDRGRELLSSVAQMPAGSQLGNLTDRLAVESKFEFLRDLARTGDLGPQQEIMFLEDLQFDWRGDETEGKILKRLGELYAGTRQYRAALDHLKTYAVAFPHAEDIDEVTEEMRDTFVAVFQPENRDLLDRLGLLGMYYDFRELTPADLRGDYVMETVAQELDTALLYRRAADLFENQLTYRLTDKNEKVAMAAELAALYRKSLDPNLALATLRAYPPEGVAYEVKRVWDLEASRVYLALNMPDKARTYLTDYVDDYAQDVLVDIAWKEDDYATIARVLAQRYDTAEHEGFESIRVRSDFIRLAYALVQLGQKEALAQLVTNYKEPMKNYPEVADIVNVYATQLKLGEDVLPILRDRPLQKIAQELINMNTFEEKYNGNLAVRKKRQEKREEYNSKMRYMQDLQDKGLI